MASTVASSLPPHQTIRSCGPVAKKSAKGLSHHNINQNFYFEIPYKNKSKKYPAGDEKIIIMIFLLDC
jgi:hypothetical protein